MTEKLFDQTDDPVEIDPNKNYLEELVGDGKKFKSPEDLAKGKYEADQFIAVKNRQYDDLYSEYTKLREEHNAGAKLQELLDQLKEQQQLQQDSSRNNTDTNEGTPPAIKPEDIDNLLEKRLTEREQRQREQVNLNVVRDKLTERFGRASFNALKEQADQLGLSETDLENMSRRNPKLFFKTFGLDETQTGEGFQAPPKTQQRKDNFAPNVQKRTLSYYNELRKNKPGLYLDPKISIQMRKDMEELGEDVFFDV